MNKAVLISIQPKWCELIADGKKTVEVRKSAPKLETPFKCYIYCTKGFPIMFGKDCALSVSFNVPMTEYEKQLYPSSKCWNGKVIGEFVCDKIYDITYIADYTRESVFFSHHGKDIWESQDIDAEDLLEQTNLSMNDIIDYMGKKRECYGWHISDLKIYEKPKELGEFFMEGECDKLDYCGRCSNFHKGQGWLDGSYCDEDCCLTFGIKPFVRPPQSWAYCVEVSK